MSEARERRIIHWIVRSIVALFAIALLIYPADWVVWETQRLFGGGIGSVDVSHLTVAELKSNKEEYYPDGVQAVACSRSLFPQGGNSACWWLRRHPEVTERY
jgi:hypothetical protein